jgi:hypothetical protein
MSQSQYIKWDLLERKERLQLEKCSGAQKLVTHCSGEGWGFYGHFNSGLGGFFSLAMDSWAFSGLHLYWGRGDNLGAFCSSALWQIYQTLYLFFRIQKCGFTIPSQGAGMQASNSSGYRNDIALQGG